MHKCEMFRDRHLSVVCVPHQVTVSEHLPAGSAVITVTATDCDFGDNGKITYRVVSSTKGVFYIDPSNGKVILSTLMVIVTIVLFFIQMST